MSNKVAPVPAYDIFQQLKSETMKDLKVCLPGSIVDLNSNGTVNVSVGVMQKIPKLGIPTGIDTLYPQLNQCPVFNIQGGGVGSIMPVSIGDECLIVFSDRCIDAWFATGQPNPLPSLRLHDINDGFVLVGLNSQMNSLSTPLLDNEGGICETENPTGAKVVVNSETSLVSIKNGTQNLALALSNLVTALGVLNTAIATTSPTNISTAIAAAAGNEAAIIAVQTALTGLLY